jgi:hypothetical protein
MKHLKKQPLLSNKLTLSNNSLNEKAAIAAYQSMDKEQQRQGIQLLLGVDTFV